MKKMILLVILLSLLLVGTARADGAWILWEDQGKGWGMVGAWPTYAECKQHEKIQCLIWDVDITGNGKCDETPWGHRYENEQKGKLVIWKCFPESVSPRR